MQARALPRGSADAIRSAATSADLLDELTKLARGAAKGLSEQKW
jgi:hypothetical protein